MFKATVIRSDTNHAETYTGLTEGKFKIRYNKHMSDFRHEKYENSNNLSKYIWKLKYKGYHIALPGKSYLEPRFLTQ